MTAPERKPSPNAAPLMTLERVGKRFGVLKALDDVDLDVHRGEILGVAGPNGAGKTTLLNVCTGVLPVTSGSITFEGHRVDGLPSYHCCHLGIARTFQLPQIFSSMTVRENVATGAAFGAAGKAPVAGRGTVEDVIELVGLAGQQGLPASRADLITRKRIMLAAALATQPKLVFLDEPMSGLNAAEVETFVALFRRLHHALDLTFVIVEHKVRALAALSHRILILHFGKPLLIEVPQRVLSDARVIEIYLGTRNLA